MIMYRPGVNRGLQCAGFTSDVKLMEVVFSKSGEFIEVRRAMELTGHRASVLSVSFSNDSKRCVRVCQSGFGQITVLYTEWLPFQKMGRGNCGTLMVSSNKGMCLTKSKLYNFCSECPIFKTKICIQ